MEIENVKTRVKALEKYLSEQARDKWLLHYVARRLPVWGLLVLIVFAYKLAVIYLNRTSKDSESVISFKLDSFIFINSSFVQGEYTCWIAVFVALLSGYGIYKFYVKRKELAEKAEEIEKSAWFIMQISMSIIVFTPLLCYLNQEMALLIACFYNTALIILPMLLNKIFGYTRSYERTLYLSKRAQMLIEKIDDNFFNDGVSAGNANYELREKVYEMKFLNTAEDAFYLLEQISSKLGKK